jgi:predicted nucleic acid-binding Zn ribbon protein
MRKAQDQPLAMVINQMIDQYRLRPKLNEVAIVEHWEEIMGKPIANQTRDIYLKRQKLYLRFESSILKQELLFAKEKIIHSFNEKLGNEAIKEIIFL